MWGPAKAVVKKLLPAAVSADVSKKASSKSYGEGAKVEPPKESKLRVADYLTPIDSPVRVLFTSGSSAGSWQIRGEQIAACRTNWQAAHKVTDAEIKSCDVVCIVKRHERVPVDRIKKLKKPIVFDIVDSWAQPDDGVNCPDLASVQGLFADKWQELGADGYIFPNQCMKWHLRKLVPFGTHIYHHYYPPLEPIRIRPEVEAIGYEGNESYLGPWHEVLLDICRRKGIKFVVNPRSLTDIDIGIAARGGMHDSFLANMYKSNVKLANFYGAGIPCIVTAKDRSYQETDQGDVRFFADAKQLEQQIDDLMSQETRQRIQNAFLAARDQYHISVIADSFDRFFQELIRRN